MSGLRDNSCNRLRKARYFTRAERGCECFSDALLLKMCFHYFFEWRKYVVLPVRAVDSVVNRSLCHRAAVLITYTGGLWCCMPVKFSKSVRLVLLAGRKDNTHGVSWVMQLLWLVTTAKGFRSDNRCNRGLGLWDWYDWDISY